MDHSIEMNKEEEPKVFSWLKGYNTGKWSSEEHAQFIKCLKNHGIDWPMLKKMVPTRKRLQIKSHLRKYFNKIKKIYGLEDPMEYIISKSHLLLQNNDCENLRFHKNEHYGRQSKCIEKEEMQKEMDQRGDRKGEVEKRVGCGETGEIGVGDGGELKRSMIQKKRDVKYDGRLRDELGGGDKRGDSQVEEHKVFEVYKGDRLKQETPEFFLKSYSQTQFPEKMDEKAPISKNIPIFAHEAVIKSTVPIDIKISPGQHTSVNIVPTTNENFLPTQPTSFSMQIQGNWQSLDPTYCDPTTVLANQSQPSNSYHQGSQNRMDYKLVKLLSSCYCMCKIMLRDAHYRNDI